MKPLVVGIAGGTGSGKTTVAEQIVARLSPGTVVRIEHDSYYREYSDLTLSERRLINYDHPDSLDNELLLTHLHALREGRSVSVPTYDFVAHQREAEQRRIEPAPVIILEGILMFVDERVRACLDIKLFVDTDADIRVFRRIRRDMEQRGRTFQEVRQQYYQSVRPMHLQFVEPSKRWADVIIPEGGSNSVALDMVIARLAQASR